MSSSRSLCSAFPIALLLLLNGCSGSDGEEAAGGEGEGGGEGEPGEGEGEGEGEPGEGEGEDDCACPAGTTCGTANGIAVCRTESGIPLLSHVFVIVMENTSYSTLMNADNTPYLHGLARDWASSSDYHGVDHPSLSNYLAMTSGGTGGVSCDCQPTGDACSLLSCNRLTGSCGCGQSVSNVADQLEAAGLDWRAYAEGMGESCNVIARGDYAPKHVPFLYYDGIRQDEARCAAHVVDYDAFAADLAGAPSHFVFIAPDLVNDMHDPVLANDTNLQHGDEWLAANVPAILASPAFTDGGLLVIVWDEDDLSGVLAPDDPIPMFLLSPLARRGGFTSETWADHYALLATIEDGLGLPRLGNADGASPLADFFPPE